jgi:nucleoside-diphosphate-sugar epimerase
MSPDITMIYHVAARGRDWGPYEMYYNANVLGTQNIVNEAAKLLPHKKLKKFIHTSTVDVYGDARPTKDCTEDVVISAKGRVAPYSKTKIIAEEIVMKAFQGDLLPVTVSKTLHMYIWITIVDTSSCSSLWTRLFQLGCR